MQIKNIKIYEGLSARVQCFELEKNHKLYVFDSIFSQDDNSTIIDCSTFARADNLYTIYQFTELLNSFAANQLVVGKEYQISKITAKIVTKKEQIYLRLHHKIGSNITSTSTEKEYFLSKYEIKIMHQVLQKILQKCTPSELIMDVNRS